jgi:hypothetical protein
MSHKIIDNFLKKKDFLKIKNTILSVDFPWYYEPIINDLHEKNKKDLTCYFTHLVFDNKINSDFFEILEKLLLSKLKYQSLIRVKCNLHPRTDKLEKHEFHVDYPYPHKGAIYYINTNDGKTLLQNNIEIESIENRLLLFDSAIEHASTSATNVKARINININYN